MSRRKQRFETVKKQHVSQRPEAQPDPVPSGETQVAAPGAPPAAAEPEASVEVQPTLEQEPKEDVFEVTPEELAAVDVEDFDEALQRVARLQREKVVLEKKLQQAELDSFQANHKVESLQKLVKRLQKQLADKPVEKIEEPMESGTPFWRIECVRKKGIWRAGRFWTSEPTDVKLSDLNSVQQKQIKAEKYLTVREMIAV